MTKFGRAQGTAQFGKRQGARPAARRTSANPKLFSETQAVSREDLSPHAQSFLKKENRKSQNQPGDGGLAALAAVSRGASGFSGGKPVAGRRIVSYLLDSILFGVAWFAIVSPALSLLGFGAGAPPPLITNDAGLQQINPDITLASLGLEFLIIQYLLRIVYSVAFEASGLQATPGKMALGLVVVGKDNGKPGFTEGIARNTFARFVSYMVPFMIGLVMALFRQDKKTIHDMMSGTQVCTKSKSVAVNYGEVFA